MTGTRTHPPAAGQAGATPLGARLLVGIPTAGLLALVALASLWMLHWGVAADPVDQLRRDLSPLVVAAVSGALCGGLLGWTAVGGRRSAVLIGAALGLLPAALMVAAYVTDRF